MVSHGVRARKIEQQQMALEYIIVCLVWIPTGTDFAHVSLAPSCLRALPRSVADLVQVPLFPAPSASHPGAALVRQGARDYEPAHLVLGGVLL